MSRLAKPKDNKAVNIQAKLANAMQSLKAALVERDAEIEMILTSLLCQEHALLVGPPGTAKSMVVDAIAGWITGCQKPFVLHCCKDTTRSVAFGPLKLSAMKRDKTERDLTGGAADSQFIIMEEVFKSGPAVLDMFLLLMNERTYKEGLVEQKCPLKMMLGVSNEWAPEGCETALEAFSDRFLFRKPVSYVSWAGRKQLLSKAATNCNCKPVFNYNLTLAELEKATNEIELLPIPERVLEVLYTICQELEAQGVTFGDRRAMKAMKAIKAYAYLQGHKEVKVSDLSILRYVLWSDAEQYNKCCTVIDRYATGPEKEVQSLLFQGQEVVRQNSPIEAVIKLEDLKTKMEKVEDCAEKTKGLEHIKSLIRHCNDLIITS